MGRLADEELMQLVADGETEAFALVYDRHGGVAYSVAYRIMGSRGPAEDVVQEAFLALWRSRERFHPQRGSLRSWLLGIVHNRAIDAIRRNQVHDRRRAGTDGLEDGPEAAERTDVEAARREESHRVRSAISALPAPQTRVIELAYFGGFTHTEIADMLDEPVGTVKGRMRLGLQKLRHSLDGQVAM